MEDITLEPENDGYIKIRKKRLGAMLDTMGVLLKKLYAPDVDGIVDETGMLGRSKVEAWIVIGAHLNQYADQAQRSLRQIHHELSIFVPKLSMSSMHRSMCIAAHFGNDLDKFREWYQYETHYDTLTGVYNTIFNVKKITLDDTIQEETVNPYVRACLAIDEMQKYASLSEKNYIEYGGKLLALREYIQARIPVATDFDEDSFFRHSPCCICKKSSTTESGWELYTVKVEQTELLVPVCPNCLHKTEQINWIQVAHMYFLYSMVAQSEVYKYTNTPNFQALRSGVYNIEM
jgi:hypothetical protein